MLNPKLPIDPAAVEKYKSTCADFDRRLIVRADIIARERAGDTIQTGDFERALDHVEQRGKRAQIILMGASAAIGAGLSGIVQNMLDNKPMNYYVVFGAILIVGAAVSLVTLGRR